jgi:hypothetical protein
LSIILPYVRKEIITISTSPSTFLIDIHCVYETLITIVSLGI